MYFSMIRHQCPKKMRNMLWCMVAENLDENGFNGGCDESGDDGDRRRWKLLVSKIKISLRSIRDFLLVFFQF